VCVYRDRERKKNKIFCLEIDIFKQLILKKKKQKSCLENKIQAI